jgi:hypothetical protein
MVFRIIRSESENGAQVARALCAGGRRARLGHRGVPPPSRADSAAAPPKTQRAVCVVTGVTEKGGVVERGLYTTLG